MAMTYATVTGRIVVPGTTTGIPGELHATPLTEGGVLAFPAEDYTTVGPAVADVAADGTLDPDLKIPTDVPAGTLWRLVFHPKGKGNLPVRLGDYEITASADIADLVEVQLAEITATVADNIAAAAALGATNDTATASFVADEGSATAAALSATYAARANRPVAAKDYGVIADGLMNDGPALAAALAAAGDGGTVLLPPGNLRVETPVQITGSRTLQGGGPFTTRIYAVGCNGIEVAAGVTDFRMVGVEVAAATRYSTTPNALVGIKVEGTNAARPSYHVYRDVYVDGFETAFQSRYLWSSTFDNFRSGFGKYGLDIYGLSVNNTVSASHIMVEEIAGSRAVRLWGRESPSDATDVASEGWTITGNVLYGGEIGVEQIGVTHCNISDNIIDFCAAYGVVIIDNGTHFGGNTKVAGNYIAISTATTGSAGIGCLNAVSNVQNMGNRITDNHLVVYAGSACTHGIQVADTQAFGTIRGNAIRGFSTSGAAIYLGSTSGSTVTQNRCMDTPGAQQNIYSDGGVNHIEGNDGLVYLQGGNPNVYAVDALGKKVWLGLQAHTAGTHAWGDRVINARPTVGQPKGWLCTVAGTPGTWVSEGNL